MHVIFVAAEVAPWSKVGGLGDVTAALPPALVAAGTPVTVVTPRYRGVQAPLADAGVEVEATLAGRRERGRLLVHETRGVRVVFVDHPGFYDREGIYGDENGEYADGALRFAFLCLAALRTGEALGPADVWHAHDWHGALLPVLLRARGRRDPCVLTVHNGAYQGWYGPALREALGVPPELLPSPPGAWNDWISVLHAGLGAADLVTTVSPRYTRELQDPAHTGGSAGRFAGLAAQGRLVGILNGVDPRVWDPAADAHLPAAFHAGDLAGKALCKAVVQRELGLQVREDVPLLGMVARLTGQKGADLLARAIPELTRLPCQVAVLGAGERAHEDALIAAARSSEGHMALRLGFDEGLAHRITAGADLLLMPSRFEPCGLNQLYAMRYGTAPVVHAVGGLEDSVEDHAPGREGTGFKFRPDTPEALLEAVRRAAALWRDRDGWAALQRRMMSRDFSWARSAARYLQVYRAALERASGRA